ncbi:MAG TPA: tripartite tricarboxylate transporter substrate binding protein [Burkholderiales bacterium]|nr:tripartite tricarboxylate transporter substrate binding protein [Burkholderiales bacterium]
MIRNTALYACLAPVALAPAIAAAQPYPSRPVRALVGFPPGGATDILARQIGQKLSESFGQQVIVDNRAGGGGVIAAVMARDAPADGYTVFFGTISTLATNVATNPKLPYDPLKDYAPITLTASNPYFLVVHPSVPAKSTAEFIALAKARPGQLNFASSGTGGGAHLALEYFRSMARIDMVHIPYKGAAPSMTDLIAGQVQMTFSQPAVTLAHAKAGKVRILGVTSLRRLASWPEAQPIADTVAGFEAASWQGVVLPAMTPKPIVERLHAEIVKALHSREIEGRLLAEGTEIGGIAPAEFGRYIKTEIAKWTRVVKEAGIKVE